MQFAIDRIKRVHYTWDGTECVHQAKYTARMHWGNILRSDDHSTIMKTCSTYKKTNRFQITLLKSAFSVEFDKFLHTNDDGHTSEGRMKAFGATHDEQSQIFS